MTQTYRQVRKETAERMGDDGPRLMCSLCNAPTPWDDLSALGSRCRTCFDRYCAEPWAERDERMQREQPKRALPRRQVVVGPGHIGELLAKRPSRSEVRQYADDMGIDVGGEP